jgi:hypothetical protein
MKKLLLLMLIMVVALLMLGISDTKASIADSSIPDKGITSNLSEANNSSATATITITWTTAPSDNE